MAVAVVYAVERPDLGRVYVGETVDLEQRLAQHRSGGPASGLFADYRPLVLQLEVVAKSDAAFAQLLWMRDYLTRGWCVVSELGWADAKDLRVTSSKEWVARRRGASPFGGRSPVRWTGGQWQEQADRFAQANPAFAADRARASTPAPGSPPVAAVRRAGLGVPDWVLRVLAWGGLVIGLVSGATQVVLAVAPGLLHGSDGAPNGWFAAGFLGSPYGLYRVGSYNVLTGWTEAGPMDPGTRVVWLVVFLGFLLFAAGCVRVLAGLRRGRAPSRRLLVTLAAASLLTVAAYSWWLATGQSYSWTAFVTPMQYYPGNQGIWRLVSLASQARAGILLAWVTIAAPALAQQAAAPDRRRSDAARVALPL